jgi:hypothetical protein
LAPFDAMLLDELLTTEEELLLTLEEELLTTDEELLTTEELDLALELLAESPTMPKGAGCEAQVLREIQLLPLS